MALEFSCKCCGHCCKGEGGIVLSQNDLQNLCTRLNLSAEDFIQIYCVSRNGKTVIKTNETDYCIFFVQNEGCSVHEDKPAVCKAWPYFRGNLVDAESLTLAKDFCPGIPQDIDLNEFMLQGVKYLTKHSIHAEPSPHAPRALVIADLLAQLADAENKK